VIVSMLGIARVHHLDAESPQILEIPLGMTKTLAGGRATAWFGEVELGPVVEVKCKGEIKRLELTKEEPSDECCGVRIRLLELVEDPRPQVKIEVTW